MEYEELELEYESGDQTLDSSLSVYPDLGTEMEGHLLTDGQEISRLAYLLLSDLLTWSGVLRLVLELVLHLQPSV